MGDLEPNGPNTPSARAPRITIKLAIVAAVCAGAAFAVWFAGFDASWAIATVLALGAPVAVLATLRVVEHASWDPPAREAPRGIRLVIPTIEESLAACDRLAGSSVTRRIRALLSNERDDRLARATITRRLRALLTAELRVRGITTVHEPADAVAQLLGPDALTVLQPNDDDPVTTAAIASCLDAVERLVERLDVHTPSSR